MSDFSTMRLVEALEVTAPDGSAVRPLGVLPGVAGFAHFELDPHQVSAAVVHATVEEIWYVIGGSGQMWRRQDGHEETVALESGVCLTIPLGTEFQFRAGENGLRVVAVTTPPWPVGTDEARAAHGPW